MSEMPRITKTWTERIRCPMCGVVQDATVVVYDEHPFAAYVHECTWCCYLIGESEWYIVEVDTAATAALTCEGLEAEQSSALATALAAADRVAALVEEAAAEVSAWAEQLADVVRVLRKIEGGTRE